MNNKSFIFYLLAVIYILALAVYWLHLGGVYYLLLQNILYLLTPFMGILGGIFALKVYGFGGNRTKTLIFLTLGIFCWFVGESLFNYYQYILNAKPFPSVADFFYLIAYPLFFFGLINEVATAHVNWKKINHGMLFLLAVASVAIAIMVAYFGIFLAYDPKELLFTNVIAMGYGVGDLILIITNMFVLTLVWEFRGGKISRVWMLLFFSFVFTLIADILFAIYTVQYNSVGFYRSLLDSIWMLAYVLFAAALFDFGFSILEGRQKIEMLKKKK